MLSKILLPAVLMSVLTQSGTLSPEERAMVMFIDANNASAITLLEKAVNINSGTQNFKGVQEVGTLFRSEFDALGFKTTWVDGAPFQRAGHLVAEHAGTGPRILLIGHLDTVFEPDSPFQKYERVSDSAAKGPGITDMKGGNVIIVQALKALQSAGLLKSMNIIVVMTGDEEAAGRPLTTSREAGQCGEGRGRRHWV
jgi:glutamate carboxypeptidase